LKKKEKKAMFQKKEKDGKEKSFLQKHTESIALVVSLLVCALLGFLNVFKEIDYKLYDAMLRAGRKVDKSQEILLVDIDDISIDDIGVWPWGRDIIADMLLRMKELGASDIVFDIEYLQKSSKALVPNADTMIDEKIEGTKQSLGEVLSQFAEAASSGAYSADELQQISGMMISDYLEPSLDGIKAATDDMARDNDEYFAQALQFFGNSWMTINAGMSHELGVTESLSKEQVTDENRQFMTSRDYAVSRFLINEDTAPSLSDAFGLVETGNDLSLKEQSSYRGFYPARLRFLQAAQGAGTTNVIVDSDGTRRRIELFHHLDPGKKFLWTENGGMYAASGMDKDYYIAQLAMEPLLRFLKVKSIERTHFSYILHGAEIPSTGKTEDIKIPLDMSGRMLINWAHELYLKSFKEHASAAYLYELDRAEERLYQNFSNITRIRMTDEEGYDLPYYTMAAALVEQHRQIEELKEQLLARCKGYDVSGSAIDGGIAPEDYDSYFALRHDFYDKMKEYADSGFKDTVVSLLESLDDGTNSDYIKSLSADVAACFDGIAADWKLFNSYYEELSRKFSGSFCFIGNTATASTDLGVTPFESRYPNLGTHANVMNTIMQRDFIRPVPMGLGLAFAFLVTLFIVFKIHSMSNGKKNLFGLLYVTIPVAVMVMLMILFKLYIPVFIPGLFVVSVYIAEASLNFLAVSRDRNTLRRGFDAYVSPEVVSQIVKDPSHLSLGGANKNITALFSDVKSFSGFTEMVNNEEGEQNGAVRLVAILNEYLGLLSDAIMDNKGTIDKYVGDEIVSFFGAPIDDEYNAFNACVAGIRMKQAEVDYNLKHFYADHDIPAPLLSRVGLNTGYMVVGNMGTVKKLNYTIMGNNVNLASRLEGTNKAYGSWIMCSESTWNAADAGEKKGLLVARCFDCVQVINVKKPVQLYNILGLRSELPPEQVEAAQIFNAGMKLYLNGRDTPNEPKNIAEILKAKQYFEKAKECFPNDKSSDTFIERCNGFIANGLPKVWDGVYVMQSK